MKKQCVNDLSICKTFHVEDEQLKIKCTTSKRKRMLSCGEHFLLK